MSSQKNIEKYEIYKAMKEALSKSLKVGFYYEAIFVEYAILEDRCTSLLKHAGVKYTDSKGYEIKLSTKLKKLRGNPHFVVPYIRNRITLSLIDNIEAWKCERDRLIHALAKIKYDNEAVKSIAEKGNELVKFFDNKARSVNRYFDRQKENEACQVSRQSADREEVD